MNTNLNIEAIEKMLKQGVQDGQLHVTFSEEDVEFLLAHSDPVQPSKNLVPELEQIIFEAIRERESFEIRELRKATTFGEYLRKVRVKLSTLLGFGSINDFLPASISPDKLKDLEQDQVKRLTIEEIAGVIAHFAVPYREALRLLENSFRLEDLREKKVFSTSHARVAEKPNTARRTTTTTSSMQKLLLALDSDRGLTSIGNIWEKFRVDLEKELKRIGYIAKELTHG